MRRFQYVALIWLFLAQSAFAAPIPDPETVYFKVRWNGFHVASLIFGWEQLPDGTTLTRATIRTYGLAKTVSQYKSDSLSLSKYGVPMKFKTNFSHRKSTREIILDWQDFVLTKEYNEPPEKRGKRPAVPEEKKRGAYDPLTVYFIAREKVVNGETDFTIPMYDGRRLSELQFEVLGLREDGTLEVTMKEIFLAGFTKREQEDRAKRDVTIHIYLDQRTFLPVAGKGQSIIGSATGTVVKTCKKYKDCLIEAETD